MWGKYAEKIEKTKEKIFGPRVIEFENNVKLIVEINQSEPQIKLLKDGKEILDLKSLAPEGTKINFNSNGCWEADQDNQVIYVGKFRGADCLLSYLHEVGHMHDSVNSEILNDLRSKRGYQIFRNKNNKLSPEYLRALREERMMTIESERNAWAYALRTTRKLQKEYDIEILKKIGKTEDVIKFIDNFLEKYEENFVKEFEGLNIYAKEEMVKLLEEADEIREAA